MFEVAAAVSGDPDRRHCGAPVHMRSACPSGAVTPTSNNYTSSIVVRITRSEGVRETVGSARSSTSPPFLARRNSVLTTGEESTRAHLPYTIRIDLGRYAKSTAKPDSDCFFTFHGFFHGFTKISSSSAAPLAVVHGPCCCNVLYTSVTTFEMLLSCTAIVATVCYCMLLLPLMLFVLLLLLLLLPVTATNHCPQSTTAA